MRTADLDDLARAIRAITLLHRAEILFPGRGAPSVRHHAAAAFAINRREIELSAAVAKVARERIGMLAEDRFHIDLASPGNQHHCSMMQDVRVIAVNRILERHLPVAAKRMLEHARTQGHLSRRRKIDELVYETGGI